MRKYIVFYASGSQEDPDLGRAMIWASGRSEAERIFKETYQSRRIEGILTERQYENIF